jgi:hypothetical protein
MHQTTDESGEAAAVDFAGRITSLCQAALGSELLGAYLIGSLAHGGFSRRYSDVDMALVTEAGLSSQILDRVRKTRRQRCRRNGDPSSPYFGLTGISVLADFRRWTVSITSITRSC